VKWSSIADSLRNAGLYCEPFTNIVILPYRDSRLPSLSGAWHYWGSERESVREADCNLARGDAGARKAFSSWTSTCQDNISVSSDTPLLGGLS
jgi:hypothetical protein